MKILFTDFTTRLSSIDDLKTRARGGMVSSLFLVPDVLSKLNHDVAVWSDAKQGGTTAAGVRWYTVDDYHEIASRKYDFLILNRGIGDGLPEIRARHRILWTHDLVHGGHAPNPEYLKALSATVFMSKYAERIWRLYYPQIGRSFTIPNGVDKAVFHPREKDLNYLIFISAPNRGLHRLGIIYDAVKKKTGLPVYMKAFSNMAVLHPADSDEGKFIPHEDGGEPFGTKYEAGGVQVLDPLPQPLLAEELGKAGLMILPTGYPEICSNAILQSLESGTPIVTTGNLGSAGEWIKHEKNGYLTKTHLEDYAVHLMEIMRGAAGILTNTQKHKKMIKNAERTKIHTWEEIGTTWANMLSALY
ncbi:MAG: glycosyltransferase [Desulfuromonadaceae bacterium]